jgi:hypothetical protein
MQGASLIGGVVLSEVCPRILGLNSLIILVVWEIWKHCNAKGVLQLVIWWRMRVVCGASALYELLIRWLILDN